MSAYIIDAIRTPRGKGKPDGKLFEVSPLGLLSAQLQALQTRNHLDTSEVDDVMMGCVSQVGEQGANIARAALLSAGWDQGVSGTTVNRFCASGLEAINMAAAKIMSGQDQLIVAGGVESMSRVPMGSDGGAWALDPETNIKTGFMPQGLGADLIATLEAFSREEVDRFALESHQKAARAQSLGYFKDSVVAVKDQNNLPILASDEMIRRETTFEALAQLKPAFAKLAELGYLGVALRKYPSIERMNHVHTAGNSSGISDGASAVLLASEQIVRRHDFQPKGRIVAMAAAGTEPTIMLTGPTPATQKALARAKLRVSDIDLFEVNEAFAAVVLKFAKDLMIPHEKINVNGGAIALGHPLGATGGILVSMLLDELHRQKKRYGVVTLCIGAGMGLATVIERI